MNAVSLISPLDGRYASDTRELASVFSEKGLFYYRLKVEIEFFIALGEVLPELGPVSPDDKAFLRGILLNFSEKDALKIKKTEQTTNHDVKALEYFIKANLKSRKALWEKREFIHFALTSDDVNNIAFSLMLKEGLSIYCLELEKLLQGLAAMSHNFKAMPLLSLTHGQPATPGTLGKEMAVFYLRFREAHSQLSSLRLKGKFSGATGSWNAHAFTCPEVDWISFSRNFLESLGLEFNPITTQIEPHDATAEAFHALARCNAILKDLNQDVWLYICRGIFRQRRLEGEVGSSTMPHKINPWKFENSEGNLVIANALLTAMAEKLPVSRLQRDLSDSTILRNQGMAIGHSLLALRSSLNGLSRLDPDPETMAAELEAHWEVLAEPVQVMLRKLGLPNPYEALKKLTRGKTLTRDDYQHFIRSLRIPAAEKERLLELTPAGYTGLAIQLVDQFIPKP
jgi:adenylosuccinate lyase